MVAVVLVFQESTDEIQFSILPIIEIDVYNRREADNLQLALKAR